MKIFSFGASPDGEVEKSMTPEFIVSENPADRGYNGFGRLHYIDNVEKKFCWDSHIYSVCVKDVRGKYQNLLFTNEELEKSVQRANIQKNVPAQPRGLFQIILSGELWRLF